MKDRPFFATGALRSPVLRPSQLRYAADLVLGVHRRDRVLEVDDRGDGGLGQHVLDPGRVSSADGAGAVDDELDVQAVMAQQHA